MTHRRRTSTTRGRRCGAHRRAEADAGAASDLRTVLNGLPAMIGYWDTRLRNRMANEAYVSYFGLHPDQMRGMHIRDVLGPELYAQNRPYMLRALAGEEQLFDRMIVDPAGEKRYTQASYIPDMAGGKARGFFVLVTDITARRRAEEALAEAEQRFRTLFQNAPLGQFLVSVEGVVVDVNQAGCDLLGRSREWLVGRSTADFTHPGDVERSRENLRRLIVGEVDSYRVEKRYVHADGHVVWAQLDACRLQHGDGPPHLLGQVQDISGRLAQQAELRRMASHDALTGLLNRRGLLDELERTIAGVRRYGGGGALLIVDLDHFKAVNDTRGHQAGDETLAAVGAILRARMRTTDVVARHGGDEFAVILTRATPAEAHQVGTELTARIRDAGLGLADRAISASVGVAVLDGGLSPDEALAAADLDMYEAKRRGGDAVGARPA